MGEGAPIQIVGHFKIFFFSHFPLFPFSFVAYARVPLDAGKRESWRWEEKKGGEGEKKGKKGRDREGERVDFGGRHGGSPTPNYLKYTGDATFSDIYN